MCFILQLFQFEKPQKCMHALTVLSRHELEKAKQAISLLGPLVNKGEGHAPVSASSDGLSTSASDGHRPEDCTSRKL